jgi:hypothetical protein
LATAEKGTGPVFFIYENSSDEELQDAVACSNNELVVKHAQAIIQRRLLHPPEIIAEDCDPDLDDLEKPEEDFMGLEE